MGPVNTFIEHLLNARHDASPLDPHSTLRGGHYPHFIVKEAKLRKGSTPLPRSYRWSSTAGLPPSFSLPDEDTLWACALPGRKSNEESQTGGSQAILTPPDIFYLIHATCFYFN